MKFSSYGKKMSSNSRKIFSHHRRVPTNSYTTYIFYFFDINVSENVSCETSFEKKRNSSQIMKPFLYHTSTFLKRFICWQHAYSEYILGTTFMLILCSFIAIFSYFVWYTIHLIYNFCLFVFNSHILCSFSTEISSVQLLFELLNHIQNMELTLKRPVIDSSLQHCWEENRHKLLRSLPISENFKGKQLSN